MNAENVIAELKKLATPTRAKASAWFFKTGPGQYGEGDRFIGVTVPDQRKVSKKFAALPEPEVLRLLRSPIHEHRLTALFIMVGQYRRGDARQKKRIVDLYCKNRAYVNNWDLVDSSAPYILGEHLAASSPEMLYGLARSKSLWDRRIAMIATFAWIKNGDCSITLKLAQMLLKDKHDLIHKAVGWSLREAGKKDGQTLLKFLDEHAATMPRTALRYAIERLPQKQRTTYLQIAAPRSGAANSLGGRAGRGRSPRKESTR